MGGGDLEPKIVTTERQASIRAKILPNGNIRCYQDDERKSGVSELQFTHPDNEAPTVTTEAQIKVIVNEHSISKDSTESSENAD